MLYNLTAESQILWELGNIKTTIGIIIFLLVLNVIITSSIFFKVFSKKDNKNKNNDEG